MHAVHQRRARKLRLDLIGAIQKSEGARLPSIGAPVCSGGFSLLVKEKQLGPQDARHGGVMRLLARDGPIEIKTPDAEKR